MTAYFLFEGRTTGLRTDLIRRPHDAQTTHRRSGLQEAQELVASRQGHPRSAQRVELSPRCGRGQTLIRWAIAILGTTHPQHLTQDASLFWRNLHVVFVATLPAVGAGAMVGEGPVDGFPRFWLGPQVDQGTRPIHVAFTAPSREAVDQVHAKAVDRDAEILCEARVWPEYHDRYYGCSSAIPTATTSKRSATSD